MQNIFTDILSGDSLSLFPIVYCEITEFLKSGARKKK